MIGVTDEFDRGYNQDETEPHERSDSALKDFPLSKSNTDNCDIFKNCEHGDCQIL
jgi:hypothetical protein